MTPPHGFVTGLGQKFRASSEEGRQNKSVAEEFLSEGVITSFAELYTWAEEDSHVIVSAQSRYVG